MTIQLSTIAIEETSILDIEITLKVDEISASMPIDEITAILRISKDIADKFKYNAEFILVDQTQNIGKFYVRQIVETGNNTYSLSGVSAIGLLADRSFPGKFFITESGGYYTFQDALAEIIGDDINYVIEDESATFDVRGFIGHCSRREAIRHLCMVSGVTVYNKNGVLHFRRSFGGLWSGTIDAEHSYQPSEVFDDFNITNGVMYSHFAVDVFFYTDAAQDTYVTDPATGKKYFYYTEKIRQENPNYPQDMPTNELYIQEEKLVSSYSFGFSLLSRLEKYYNGGISLDFRVIDNEAKYNGVGFFTGEKMVFGYPSQITISYGKALVYERLNSIQYSCEMAYFEDPRYINVNYITEANDLLYTRQIIKGSEETFTIKHPVIDAVIDNRHKVIYRSTNYQTIHNDNIYSDPVDIDIMCEAALIQDGDLIEIRSIDEAYQDNTVLEIGGTING